jgi:hypothetical protein|tara:strand:+ start:139 stop:339 length:201 start_codon:yes stop_codon:yes gene_type:complete
MAKFGMYTKGTNEANQHVSVVEVRTKQEAEAYFAGRKQLSLVQFHNMFVVREINNNINENKNLLLG